MTNMVVDELEAEMNKLKLTLLINDLNELDTDLLRGVGRYIERRVREREGEIILVHTLNEHKNIKCDYVEYRTYGIRCWDKDTKYNLFVGYRKVKSIVNMPLEEYEAFKEDNECIEL